ncbi:MAG: Hsp70 family protein [Pseudomonadota bacterium]|nr:Hsp70 family protein [Pseudomonadota bacterium]
MSQSKETIIGIDLGTTNSEVAVWRDGRAAVIADENGRKILPSFVGIADDGAVLVGEPARNQYPLYPERTVKSIKRRMGSGQTVEMGDKAYTPQEISAIILRRLKAIAERHLGRPVSKAVITVPAYFNDAQRQATREAGAIAGLEVVRIINEPTAAALSYEAAHHGHKHILVYDLGGGTFDVSVVRLEDDVVEVLASHGNNHLGGDDFDQKIVDHLLRHLHEQHGVDATQSRQAMARLGRAAEAAKIALSDQPFASVEEEYLLERDGRPVHLALELSRQDYEAMIEPYIRETLEAVHLALKGARLMVADIDEVLLVGGATRTPVIGARLEQELGRQPRGEVDPDLCVALGAAIQAAMIAGENVSSVLVDITPYTFGTSAVGEIDGIPTLHHFVPIIHKNTPIPVTKSEVFFTLEDEQEVVDVKVYQGEDPDALNNVLIGRFTIEGLSEVPAGNPIILRLSLDLDGVLNVSAVEKKTGLEKSITIDNALRRYGKEDVAAARARIGALFDEDEALEGGIVESAEASGARDQARALVEKAERMLESAAAEDREEMIDLIETIRDALAAGDAAALTPAMSALADILYYLES